MSRSRSVIMEMFNLEKCSFLFFFLCMPPVTIVKGHYIICASPSVAPKFNIGSKFVKSAAPRVFKQSI